MKTPEEIAGEVNAKIIQIRDARNRGILDTESPPFIIAAAIRQARRDALEQAAKVARDAMDEYDDEAVCLHIETGIRALIGKDSA